MYLIRTGQLQLVNSSHMYVGQWLQKLENFEGDGDGKFGVEGGYPFKNSLVLSICFLPIENFATFLDFI